LGELEEQTRTQTRGLEQKVLAAIEQMLDLYLSGFQQIGKFTRTDNNRLEQVWVFLTIRAFNSMRWAYYLLESGYFSQSMMLTRTAFEDWLVSMDCIEHSETVEAILGEKGRVPKFSTMANRLEKPLKKEWKDIEGDDGVYGLLSTFSHPRYRAIAVLLDPKSKVFRVGPAYDDDLFLVASNYLLLGLIRMMEFLARLVDPIEPNWTQAAKPILDQSQVCRGEVLARAKARLEARNKQ
jgi:hypothetical protein